MKPSYLKPITALAKTRRRKTTISSAMNINENQQEYIVYVAVPGMQREDFNITVEKRKLVLSACKREAIHCFTGGDKQPRWSQRFTLPADADTVMTAAVYRNGELQIHIPKGKPEVTKELTEIYVY